MVSSSLCCRAEELLVCAAARGDVSEVKRLFADDRFGDDKESTRLTRAINAAIVFDQPDAFDIVTDECEAVYIPWHRLMVSAAKHGRLDFLEDVTAMEAEDEENVDVFAAEISLALRASLRYEHDDCANFLVDMLVELPGLTRAKKVESVKGLIYRGFAVKDEVVSLRWLSAVRLHRRLRRYQSLGVWLTKAVNAGRVDVLEMLRGTCTPLQSFDYQHCACAAIRANNVQVLRWIATSIRFVNNDDLERYLNFQELDELVRRRHDQAEVVFPTIADWVAQHESVNDVSINVINESLPDGQINDVPQ